MNMDVKVIYIFVTNIRQTAKKLSHHGLQITLSHASEKAVEAYFTLFHLLLCLATEQPALVHFGKRYDKQLPCR